MAHSPSALSFGRIGTRTVFMDLDADLYFTVAREEEGELMARAAGLASDAAPGASIFEQTDPQRVCLRDALPIFMDLVRIRRALRTRPIAGLVARVAGAAVRGNADTPGAATLARRFAAVRTALPVGRACLPDSLALIAWLGRHGIDSTLVFGVKLDPFAAHCWVQAGDLLLSERLEEIERLTPVRSIACAPATH